MQVATYLRVSTGNQTVENQRRDLAAYCQRRGWTEVTEYADEGISGTKDRRPALDRMLREVRGRRVDVVLCTAFDRIARSTRHLVTLLEEMQHVGCALVSIREQIDTGSPVGKVVFTIMAAIGEFERALVVERIHSGLRRARAQGKRLGRPRAAVNGDECLRAVVKAGSQRAAARLLKIDERTLRSRLQASV